MTILATQKFTLDVVNTAFNNTEVTEIRIIPDLEDYEDYFGEICTIEDEYPEYESEIETISLETEESGIFTKTKEWIQEHVKPESVPPAVYAFLFGMTSKQLNDTLSKDPRKDSLTSVTLNICGTDLDLVDVKGFKDYVEFE